MQANRKIHLCQQKSPHLHVVPSQQTPKRSKFSVTNISERPVDFLRHQTSVDVSLRNTFTNLGSFEKVSIPVESIIPCYIKVLVLLLPAE